jgi:hypothetical protein
LNCDRDVLDLQPDRKAEDQEHPDRQGKGKRHRQTVAAKFDQFFEALYPHAPQVHAAGWRSIVPMNASSSENGRGRV